LNHCQLCILYASRDGLIRSSCESLTSKSDKHQFLARTPLLPDETDHQAMKRLMDSLVSKDKTLLIQFD